MRETRGRTRNEEGKMELSHIDKDGNARMVDVSAKPETDRIAVAECAIYMSKEALDATLAGGLPKGDALATAKIAGIQAAKRASDLIPMCHNIALTSAEMSFRPIETGIAITSRCRAFSRTGVEMEALTACSVAALTVYDMVKAIDKRMVVSGLCLLEKSGGKSGNFAR